MEKIYEKIIVFCMKRLFADSKKALKKQIQVGGTVFLEVALISHNPEVVRWCHSVVIGNKAENSMHTGQKTYDESLWGILDRYKEE